MPLGATRGRSRQFRRPPQVERFDGEAITNSFAVDAGGGIYVVNDRRMHKVVWTGERLSQDAADGAWSVAYDLSSGPQGGIRAGSGGSGSTPTLMGFGPDEDHLVVLTDGAAVMNLVAFWRDEVPAGSAGSARAVAGSASGPTPTSPRRRASR